MKKYTAIYSTNALKNIQYSFDAKNIESAIEFCKGKFEQYSNLAIIENNHDFIDKKANEGILVYFNGFIVK